MGRPGMYGLVWVTAVLSHAGGIYGKIGVCVWGEGGMGSPCSAIELRRV